MKQKTQHKIRQIYCPYCDVLLRYRGANRIQLGKWNFFFEHWDNWRSGALNVQIYECPKCGKIELFRIR